ncbi:MAG: sulfite exporter TauE/SafE family protein [Qingshengfaniella sp.]
MTPDIAFWIAAGLATLLLGLAKGGIAIAASLVVPVMSLVMPPINAAGLLLPLFLLSDIYAVWLFRSSFSRRNLTILIPAGVLGVIAGFLLVSHISENTSKLIVAGVGLWFLIDRLRDRYTRVERPPRPADLPRGLFWGILAGVTSYISHSGGPPFQAYMLPQKLPKMVFAGTATFFFACVNLAKLPAFILAGQVTLASTEKVILLTPLALIGARMGYRLTEILSDKLFFALIELALLVVSFKLLWDVATS